jgi:hypothetical protein
VDQSHADLQEDKQPRDELEAMLAVQMGAIHQATMMMARRLNHMDNITQQDAAERALNKLARTYATQMETLKRYRTGGQQKVTVEHVTVNQGGKAICPEGEALKQFRRNYLDPNSGPTGKDTARNRALKEVCQVCPSKAKCCPNAEARKINREETEDARQVARDIAKTRQYDNSMKLRKKSKYYLPTSNGFWGSDDCDYAARAAQMTNSCSPQPPKTSANWPRSFLHLSKREKPDQKSARVMIWTPLSALATRCFSTEWAVRRTSPRHALMAALSIAAFLRKISYVRLELESCHRG